MAGAGATREAPALTTVAPTSTSNAKPPTPPNARSREHGAGPFIFIATNELKSGAFRVERQRVADLSTLLQAREPRLIAFNEYAHDDGSTVSVVQIHPGLHGIHMELVREEAARAYTETVEATTGTQVFGTPSSTVLEVLNQEAGSGVPTSIVPLHVAGFTRTGSKTHTWASHFDVSGRPAVHGREQGRG